MKYGIGHPPLCAGCEACQPTTARQREADRAAAAYRVEKKRRLRLLTETLDWPDIQTLSNAVFWHRRQAQGEELQRIARIEAWLDRVKADIAADRLVITIEENA
jgi:hypothetical protein